MANPGISEEDWRQAEKALVEAGGNRTAAARSLKMDRMTFVNRITSGRLRYNDCKAPYEAGRATFEGGAPDGYLVKGRSTFYGPDGDIRGEWVKTSADMERQQEMFRIAVQEMAKDIPRAKPVKPPKADVTDLLAAYPIGDHHLGMYAWPDEARGDWTVDIAEEMLASASNFLMKSVPSCQTALIAVLGDFLHYDSHEAVTPTSHNRLDPDTRFQNVVRIAIRSLRRFIEAALKRHERVHVIVEIGNHDLASAVWMMELLASHYEDEPRITVDTSPQHFHFYEFGKVLIGTHHGHGVKMAALPLIMAHDQQEAWARTTHRHWWTGHIHHAKTQAATSAQDFTGCTVESFRVLGPTDAWASQKGYRSKRTMQAIVFHKDFGEAARYTVNPEMLAEAA